MFKCLRCGHIAETHPDPTNLLVCEGCGSVADWVSAWPQDEEERMKIKIELEHEEHIGTWLTLYIDGERKFSFIPRMPDEERPRSAYEFNVEGSE